MKPYPKIPVAYMYGYRPAAYGEATCDGCISNIGLKCDVVEMAVDGWHVCSKRVSKEEEKFLARRIREALQP